MRRLAVLVGDRSLTPRLCEALRSSDIDVLDLADAPREKQTNRERSIREGMGSAIAHVLADECWATCIAESLMCNAQQFGWSDILVLHTHAYRMQVLTYGTIAGTMISAHERPHGLGL